MKSSSFRAWLFVLAGLVVLSAAPAAWAWGPATHIHIAQDVLANLGLLPAALAALLAKHRLSYLYGCIAADVVFAKRLSRVKQFCHHWSTGFQLLNKSRDDERLEAFAYGYLSHLAADTVAHGKYVPRQTLMTGGSINVGHLLWELRAEALADPQAWACFRELRKTDHAPEHRLLAYQLKGTFLPFALNRRLFDGMNSASLHPSHRQTLDVIESLSRFPLCPKLVEDYREECVDRTLSLLSEQTDCPVLREDPNGTAALMQVHVLRRDLRRWRRLGKEVKGHWREMTASLGPNP